MKPRKIPVPAREYWFQLEIPRRRNFRMEGSVVATHEFAAFMESIHRELAADFQRIGKRVREDPGTAGDQAEETWAALLRNWLPATYPVVTKGRILNELGYTSPQVDILVLQPHYPKALRNQKLYFAAGVVAAFECKLTLRRAHVREFFESAKIIKNLYEQHTGTPYDELVRPIYYGLLAHSHGWRGSASQAEERIRSAIAEYESIADNPAELPDALCVSNVATFVCSREVCLSKELKEDEKELFSSVSSRGGVATCFYGHADHDELPSRGTVLGALLTNLIYRLAFEDPSLQKFADYLLQISMSVASGRPLAWPPDVLSKEVQRQILREGLHEARWSPWNGSY